jgi:hypothetical protein
VLETPGINPGLRAELVLAVAEELPEYLRMSGDVDLVIDFLAATLPDVAEAEDPEGFGRLVNLRRLLLEESTMSASSLAHLARALTPLLDAQSTAPVSALVTRTLEKVAPEDLPMLVDCFLLPLTVVTRTMLAERIARLPSLSGGDDLPYYLQVLPADGFRRAPPDLRDRFLRSWAGTLTARYAERAEADSFRGPFDNMLSRALRVVRLADGFGTNAPLFLPLLRLGCPRQADEAETAYASRIARIESLWLQDRIFLHDRKGGTVQHPEYLDVFTDFAITHPGWLHLLFLSLDEPGRAETNGSAQFDWLTYSTPYLIANSLLHEGAHALDLLGDPEDPRINQLSRYWYFHRPANSRRLVSDYAATNSSEFWADHARFWYQDTRTWFQRALHRYAEGEPGMLHVFLFLWNLGDPKDAPGAGQKALFRLRDDGRLQRDYVPAGWTSGNPKLGEFHATAEGEDYVFQYREGFIQTVMRDGQRIAGLDTPPTFRVPTRVTLAEDGLLILTNLVLNPEPGLKLSLLEGPPGLSLDAASSSLSWKPAEAEAGLDHVVRLRATAPGPVARSASLRLVVTVDRRLRAAPVAPLVGPEHRTLLTQIEIADPGSTRPPLLYAVVPPRPGLDVDVVSGQVLFTPTEDDGPGDSIVTIQIRDSSTPPKLTTVEILARITEVNQTPTIQTIAAQIAYPGRVARIPLVVTDPDRPANRLTFDLPVGFPAGASVSEDGLVTWMVPSGTRPGRYRWTARVRDNGTPSLSASTTLTVDVQDIPPLTLSVAAVRPGEFDLAITGESGATGQLEATTDFVTWQFVAPVALTGNTAQVTVSAAGAEAATFFRVRLP